MAPLLTINVLEKVFYYGRITFVILIAESEMKKTNALNDLYK